MNLSYNSVPKRGAWKYPSLPGSPVREHSRPVGPVTETPILDLLGQRPVEYSSSSLTYDYHAAQLERFLQEYRSLQEQLNKMKQTCESIQPEEQPRSILKNKGAHSSSSVEPYWVPRNSLYTGADYLPS